MNIPWPGIQPVASELWENMTWRPKRRRLYYRDWATHVVYTVPERWAWLFRWLPIAAHLRLRAPRCEGAYYLWSIWFMNGKGLAWCPWWRQVPVCRSPVFRPWTQSFLVICTGTRERNIPMGRRHT